MQDNLVKMLGPLCGRKCRGSFFYCALCCKVSRNKSSLVVTSLQSPRLSVTPPAQMDESFRKPQLHFYSRAETPHSKSPPSRSKHITNWISMWYIHYCKTLCSPQKARHPLLSLTHTSAPPPHHHHPSPLCKTAYAGSSELG